MGYAESDLLPISGLQHLVFCERQCALIHVDRIWVENRLTAEGRVVHERVHETRSEGGGRVVTAVHLRSLRLGLFGVADAIEFPSGPSSPPCPVEYKRGRVGARLADRVQLCAQAMALEEMTGKRVSEGALFYASSRRRISMPMTEELRERTEDAARRFHELVRSGRVPVAFLEPKCKHCSLLEVCQPAPRKREGAEAYVDRLFVGLGEP